MKYSIKHTPALGEVAIEIAANNHTDSFPLVNSIIVRKVDIDLAAKSIPLVAALLTGKYCGESFEFTGVRIGNDYAEAIRRAVNSDVTVANVDAMYRNLSTGEVDIQVQKATTAFTVPVANRPQDNVPIMNLNWSGDPVDQKTKNSSKSALGTMFTNALLFADEATVNVAMALLYGRDKVRTIYVPGATKEQVKEFNRILRPIAVDVVAVEV